MATVTTESYPFTVDPYDDYYFEGLGRQNMSFQHALAELLDNSIAASSQPFHIDVYVARLETGTIHLRLVDQGSGMSIEDLTTRALKLGGRPVSDNRLNEHGWGLKNALCAFTGNQMGFLIQTRDAEAIDRGAFYSISGPFRREMVAEAKPAAEWATDASPTTGTVVTVETTLPYFQSVQQTSGPRATNLATLVGYLVEHLAVLYRGYLGTLIPGTGQVQGQITIHHGDSILQVPHFELPMNAAKRDEIVFTAGGVNYTAVYRHGVLDEAVRDTEGFKLYYQGEYSNSRN